MWVRSVISECVCYISDGPRGGQQRSMGDSYYSASAFRWNNSPHELFTTKFSGGAQDLNQPEINEKNIVCGFGYHGKFWASLNKARDTESCQDEWNANRSNWIRSTFQYTKHSSPTIIHIESKRYYLCWNLKYQIFHWIIGKTLLMFVWVNLITSSQKSFRILWQSECLRVQSILDILSQIMMSFWIILWRQRIKSIRLDLYRVFRSKA